MTSNIVMPVVGLALLIFVGWVVKDSTRVQEINPRLQSMGSYNLWLLMTKYVSPNLVLIILIYGIYQKFSV